VRAHDRNVQFRHLHPNPATDVNQQSHVRRRTAVFADDDDDDDDGKAALLPLEVGFECPIVLLTRVRSVCVCVFVYINYILFFFCGNIHGRYICIV